MDGGGGGCLVLRLFKLRRILGGLQLKTRDTDFGLADWKRFLSSPRSNMAMLNDRRFGQATREPLFRDDERLLNVRNGLASTQQSV